MKLIKMPSEEDPVKNTGSYEEIIAARRNWIYSRLDQFGKQGPLRALIASNSLTCGGAEHQILWLIPRLNELGIITEHFYYGGSHFLKPQFQKNNICTHFIHRDEVGQLQFWKKTVTLMRSKSYDILHAFVGTANFYARGSAKLAGIPVIFGGWRNRYSENRFLLRMLYSLLNYVSHAWIINAAPNAEALQKFWGMKRLPVYVVPNAIECNSIKYNSPEPLSPDFRKWVNGRLIVGTVGRITPVKNFDLFIDIAAKISGCREDVCFCLIGGSEDSAESGSLERRLKKRIENENLASHICLLGRKDNVAALLPHFSLFVCTSDTEGCPNAVIEAMRAELPVVMTACTDTANLVHDGMTGYVVPIDNVVAMTDKINRLLDDKNQRMSFGKEGKKLAKKYFEASNSAWMLGRIYVKEWDRIVRKRGRQK